MNYIVNSKIEKIIEKFSFSDNTVVVTQNKKLSSASNFRLANDLQQIHHDGFWISRPTWNTKISTGIHFQKSEKNGPNLIWYGKWLEPEQETDGTRWIFRLARVKGPFETYSSFYDLFGVHAQASFVYMRKQLPTKKLAEMATAAKSVQKELEVLLHKLANVPIEGAEVSILAKRRMGHGELRNAVHALFGGTCCLTNISNQKILVCSHIKPWSACTPTEKVSHHNTLLLAANWDAAFDKHLVSFNDSGSVVKSISFKPCDAKSLGLDLNLRLPKHFLTAERLKFLKYHRAQLIH